MKRDMHTDTIVSTIGPASPIACVVSKLPFEEFGSGGDTIQTIIPTKLTVDAAAIAKKYIVPFRMNAVVNGVRITVFRRLHGAAVFFHVSPMSSTSKRSPWIRSAGATRR